MKIEKEEKVSMTEQLSVPTFVLFEVKTSFTDYQIDKHAMFFIFLFNLY